MTPPLMVSGVGDVRIQSRFRSSVNWGLNRDTDNESKSSYQFACLYHSYKITFL